MRLVSSQSDRELIACIDLADIRPVTDGAGCVTARADDGPIRLQPG